MASAYERGTQAPMDITELAPRKRTLPTAHAASVFDAHPPAPPIADLSMASADASLMDIDPDEAPPAHAPLTHSVPCLAPVRLGAVDEAQVQSAAPHAPPLLPAPTQAAPPSSTSAPPSPKAALHSPRAAPSRRTSRRSASDSAAFLLRPDMLLTYAQVIFNASILFVFLYLLFNLVWTIQHDVSQKVREYELDYLGEISSCQSRYASNRCGSDMQAPALAEACDAWRRCASRDPTVVGRARVTAETFAEILNGFVDVVSWKTMLFSLLTLSIVVGATNSTLSFFRVNASQTRHDALSSPPPPPPDALYPAYTSAQRLSRARRRAARTDTAVIPYDPSDDSDNAP